MAGKLIKSVTIRVLTSFNGMHRGDESTIPLSSTVQGWINAGLVEVMARGTDPAGQGAVEQADQGGIAFGAGDSGQAGDEPGEGFGSGGYGTAPGIDQD